LGGGGRSRKEGAQNFALSTVRMGEGEDAEQKTKPSRGHTQRGGEPGDIKKLTFMKW